MTDVAKSVAAAMEARDHGAVVAHLAPDVTLRSPIIRTRFEGREALSEAYAEIIAAMDDYRCTALLEGDGIQQIEFEMRMGGREFSGVDMIRLDEQGRIVEMTVMLRPLVGLLAFTATIGPRLARRKGGWQGVLMTVLSKPLPLLGVAVDLLAPRLTRLRA